MLLFSVAVATWSVSALASTLAEAFNAAYRAPEARRGWKQSALALISGPLIALSLILSMTLMLTAPQVAEGAAEVFGLRELFVLLWGWLRYPVALVLLWAVLSIVYRFGSAVRPRFGTVVPGAALAVIAWAVVSVGFSIYLANFADYGATYGGLGAAVGLLFYFNLSASIVLAGAEVNAAIYHSTADMATQAEKQDVERETSTVRDGKIGDA